MRNCPVVSRDTLVAGTEVDGGSRILVTPAPAGDVGELRAEVRRRLAALASPPTL